MANRPSRRRVTMSSPSLNRNPIIIVGDKKLKIQKKEIRIKQILSINKKQLLLRVLGITSFIGAIGFFSTGTFLGINAAVVLGSVAVGNFIPILSIDDGKKTKLVIIKDRATAEKVAKIVNGTAIKTNNSFIIVKGKAKKFIEARDKPFRQISITKS